MCPWPKAIRAGYVGVPDTGSFHRNREPKFGLADRGRGPPRPRAFLQIEGRNLATTHPGGAAAPGPTTSRCTLNLLNPVSLAIVRTLQGPPWGACVRTRLRARPIALIGNRGLRPRSGVSLSRSKPLAVHRFLQCPMAEHSPDWSLAMPSWDSLCAKLKIT